MSKIDSNSSKKALYLDAGNSSIKGAYKKGVNWEAIHTQKNYTASELVQWIDDHPESFSHIVLSSVRDDVRKAIRSELSHVNLLELTTSDIPRELLDYETVETLGIDRFLACYGATDQVSDAVVVIDAGTALTIDYMDQDDVYHGGLIAPGLSAFGGILPQKAPALPNVEMDIPEIWPGKSTIDSLKWGQAGFYKMAIQGVLKKYEDTFGHYELFVTGGDASLVELLTDRECKVRPFLVFDGMKKMESSGKRKKGEG
ncbi:MAG: type III pantothenate kinase [Gracilimonas sp.]|uniref:type III pantothenate kinase n=1 Tax=Gracilimonas TaxID=649462 RepID=UPI001B211AC4|nr:type III pantothenate kinase [Gracilimonas sp.]MBO6587253.1 type III pantothenate kinase [Gracilimonas sp.]MBO6614259.1 type III pantothenate kinase [Gracilimonas sp.]